MTVAGALSLPAVAPGASLLGQLPVVGKTKNGNFKGEISIKRFTLFNGSPVALATLTGRVTDSRYPSPQAVYVRALRMPLAVAPVAKKSCSVVTITLGPEKARLFGLPGALAPARLSLKPNPRTQRSLNAVACLIGRASKAGDIAALLRALESLRQLHGARR